MIFYVILFVIGRFASCCLSLVLSSVFLNKDALWVSFLKKEINHRVS